MSNSKLDQIPREHLIEMLKESMFYSHGGPELDGKEGFSLDVEHETAIRDVVYRKAPLFPTAEEAIVHHWERTFRQ